MVFHRVEKAIALDNLILKIKFRDGSIKYYSVEKLVSKEPQPTFEGEPIYERLRNKELFPNVYVDCDGAIVAWDTVADISCNELWENGIPSNDEWTAEDDQRCNPIPADRYYVVPEPDPDKSEIGCFNEIVVQIFPCKNPETIPHIVASYRGETGRISINDGSLIDGTFPPTGIELVGEWLDIHHNEIQEMWDTGVLRALPTLQ